MKCYKDLIRKTKAMKLSNYGRPTYCLNCGKMMKPQLHVVIIRESFLINDQMCQLYKDTCEWCGNEFEYWA